MTLSLGFSPCPNDTFIFDALVNGKIDTEGLEFSPVLEDVQTLNDWACTAKLDITKLSFPALFNNQSSYAILSSGSALGKGVGPLLIAREAAGEQQVEASLIAIPGENTTANFLLSYAFPSAKQKVVKLFSSIEDAVLNGVVDMGVIIHENRFTYKQKGLHKVCDLGDVWETREGMPIPLGCIAAKRSLPDNLKQTIDRLIKKSLAYAFQHYPALPDYVWQHAQAMEEEVMRKHIDLYVNNFSLDLGKEGKAAVEKLFAVYQRANNNKTGSSLFVSY